MLWYKITCGSKLKTTKEYKKRKKERMKKIIPAGLTNQLSRCKVYIDDVYIGPNYMSLTFCSPLRPITFSAQFSNAFMYLPDEIPHRKTFNVLINVSNEYVAVFYTFIMAHCWSETKIKIKMYTIGSKLSANMVLEINLPFFFTIVCMFCHCPVKTKYVHF